ncbi:MAG TPA: PaaI family thioesterase [Acidimicrobiales bacterium]|nr:PaaI family thioesterase [Acidimicrobiales bacterium]
MPPTPTIPPPVMTADELQSFLAEVWTAAVSPTYRVREVTASGAVLALPVAAEHERPGGTVSGPTMMGLADAAAWLATLSRVGPVALAVTSNLTIHFLAKPPLGGELLADASLLRLGPRSSVSDVRVTSATGDGAGEATLVAAATVAYSIPAQA